MSKGRPGFSTYSLELLREEELSAAQSFALAAATAIFNPDSAARDRLTSIVLDPEAYLRHVLSKIADHPVNHVDEFLPRNVILDETGVVE